LRRRTDASEQSRLKPSTSHRISETSPSAEKYLAAVILTGAVFVPIVVSTHGLDVFRLPKQLAMYATAIVAAGTTVICFLLKVIDFDLHRKRLRAPLYWTVAALVWAIAATLFSANRTLSIDAMTFAFAVAAVGLVAAFSLRGISLHLVAAAVLGPALVNVGLLTLQAVQIWNPWVFDSHVPHRYYKNALLGDTNTVGAYLLAPMIFAAVLACTAASRRSHLLFTLVASMLAAGLILSETRTAILSAVFALATLAILRLRLRALPMILLIVLGAAAVSMTYGPLRLRVDRMIEAVELNRADEATSGRLPAFIAAWEMFRAHPLTGVGPGVFKFEYLPYRVAMSGSYPRVSGLALPRGTNFGEVHNDHLQSLAETGLPGYLILLALIGSVGAVSFGSTPRATDIRAETARLLALPLCVGLSVAMLTSFPLQRAACIYTFVLLGAVSLAWSSTDDVA
jgi:O-antigen ligase